MATRAIRTSMAQSSCDVCGRTLLRGEHAEVYLHGASRRSVCELCTSRALHGGWVREGTVPEYDSSADRVDRRRSLLHRLRSRRELNSEIEGEGEAEPERAIVREASPQPPVPEWPDRPPRSPSPERRVAGSKRRERSPGHDRAPAAARDPERQGGREPRHVRAVPTSIEHRIASAVSLFNGSDHPRTVAGITRSLGLPDVSVHPRDPVASVVNVVVAWELCWYRYEVDLSDEVPSLRSAGQGYELDELSALERHNNAAADDRGRLRLA